ncbi:MAG: hypothetical protein LC796_03670 [Acidobacteria bacterium]|nr:hypothetical protein [Acidobacteriota bacterium]MCA1611422.1 hypothetical protein [Acidobacteriota bacterium]
MRPQRILFVFLGAAGLAIYLWTALRAPVILWSDSRLDLSWAEHGIGLWKAVPQSTEVHPLKPGFLLFLRAAGPVFSSAGRERSIVIVQSLLLWASIFLTCAFLARRRGMTVGLTGLLAIFCFLRLRNSASAVMSEALAAALFLPLSAIAFERPRNRRLVPVVALPLLVLFWVRPNVGVIAFLVLLAGWGLEKCWREILVVGVLMTAGVLISWSATRQFAGQEPGRGIAGVVLFGSAEYGWLPSLGIWPGTEGSWLSNPRLRLAARNWVQTLRLPAADRDRELAWRALHGIFGLEYYDARWSRIYRMLDKTERIAGLFLLVAAIALSVSAGRRDAVVAVCATSLLALLIAHNLLFASSPRLILPFLPAFLTMAAAAAHARPRFGAGPFVFLGLVVIALAIAPQVSSWDWGQIETAGVILQQRIPARALPRSSPATLHVRIAPPGGHSAHLIVTIADRVLYRSTEDHDRTRPLITVPLPPEVLRENAAAPLVMRLTSTGEYNPVSYLLFPVLPPPWRTGASRADRMGLSPGSDIDFGALDWWAHAGTR